MRFLSFLRPLLATVAFMAVAAGAHAADFKDGVDFNTVNAPRPDTGKKVEVLEFFMYHCPHCNALDPALAEWVKKNSDKIVFRRMHMGEDPQAKAFYTLEAMGVLTDELHQKIFRAIHVDHNRLNTDAALLDFLVKNGVDKAKYQETINSFGVQTKLKRGVQVANLYKLDSVPAIVIDGHYTTSPAVAGHGLNSAPAAHAAMFAVADSLVAKSLQERAGKK
ncbi:thiol:disulfide interchange protein DsbA/DsbL [Duganella callida]|uniref:Thiol:disulfide interchange protein n=1 Tax=Duganella callida TaxID=2561932 RepID=A0A4Y9SUP4_9BURK|nr:thiol:disulfide interchange protein DsbA/DsbL [Duganella callida]TFW29207.1 thiol:disulfide interchange protein DsbA/DsbL [Duganella callida]